MTDSLERNLTDQERDVIERERRAAFRALFDWLREMRLPRGVWRQASFDVQNDAQSGTSGYSESDPAKVTTTAGSLAQAGAHLIYSQSSLSGHVDSLAGVGSNREG